MSNTEPALVEDLGGGWTLRRWNYDGAPLELHRTSPGRHGPVTALVVHESELEIEIEEYAGAYYGTRTMRCFVPIDALRKLLRIVPSPEPVRALARDLDGGHG